MVMLSQLPCSTGCPEQNVWSVSILKQEAFFCCPILNPNGAIEIRFDVPFTR